MAKRTNGDRGSSSPQISKAYALKRLQELLNQLTEIRQQGRESRLLSPWQNDVKALLSQLYGEQSFLFKQFDNVWFSAPIWSPGQPDSTDEPFFRSGLEQAEGILKSRISDLEQGIGAASDNERSRLNRGGKTPSRKVFVVHGHDRGTKESVARLLEKLDLEPIILHEQADRGKTLIEKFETHSSDVSCAVVLLTADDVASSKVNPRKTESRARQNVILELGFFVGALGRDHTFALVEKDVTLPSDIHGVVYIPLDAGEWRMRLVKELKASGLEVDANRAF